MSKNGFNIVLRTGCLLRYSFSPTKSKQCADVCFFFVFFCRCVGFRLALTSLTTIMFELLRRLLGNYLKSLLFHYWFEDVHFLLYLYKKNGWAASDYEQNGKNQFWIFFFFFFKFTFQLFCYSSKHQNEVLKVRRDWLVSSVVEFHYVILLIYFALLILILTIGT